MLPAPPQTFRCLFGFAVFLALFAVVAWRLHELQVERHEDLTQRAERQSTLTTTIAAPRGGIFDRHGQPLAVSTGSWDLYADPDWMDDKLSATVHLARVLEVPRGDLRAHFESGGNGRRLAEDLDEFQADAIRNMRLRGIYLKRVYRRYYPAGNAAPHVLGMVLADGSGGAGIEQEFDALLRGTPGRQVMRADAHRQPLLPAGFTVTAARPGANLELTVDVVLQREVEAALHEAVDRHRPESACAVVLRPTTGEVVALASWPSYDLRDYRHADPESFRNQALAFVYESGSTMKPLVAGAAVAEGEASWDERIFCEDGRWTYRSGRSARTITDHSFSHGGHQWLTVVEGVAKSDNVLMAKLGLRLGPERLRDWILRFGFGSTTGIELPGENLGIMLPEDRWNRIGSCMSVPMGHEMAVTPLQMAAAHAAVANGGVLRPLRIVERVYTVDPESGEEHDLPLHARGSSRRVFDRGDAARIERAMVAVMEEGTGRRVRLDGYTIVGDTATTEKLVEVGGRRVYSDDHHIGSFVGWGPVREDLEPELLALVVIDDPEENGHYGSQTAAPVVQRILQFGLEHFGVPTDDENREAMLAERTVR